MHQAFLKWWENASDAERAKRPDIAKILGIPLPKSARSESTARTAAVPVPHIRVKVTRIRSNDGAGRPAQGSERVSDNRASMSVADAATGLTSANQTPAKLGANPSQPRAPRRTPVVLVPVQDIRDCSVAAHCDREVLTNHGRPQARARPSGTEVPGIRVAKKRLGIQVGLDFGTSTTKVLFAVLNEPERKIRPVQFKHELHELPGYALPSVATFDRSGHLLLGHLAEGALASESWDAGLKHFKMLAAGAVAPEYLDRQTNEHFRETVKRALGDDGRCTPAALMAAYLAYVLRLTRNRLTRQLGTDEFDISFNSSVPIDHRENNSVLAEYERICLCAEWLVRESTGGATPRWWVERAQEMLADRRDVDVEPRLFLVPEAIAATSAYTTSVARADGLHALVDIGAGTTDISIFRILTERSRETSSYWLAARSIPRGTSQVERAVAELMSDPSGRESVTSQMILAAITGSSTNAREASIAIRREFEAIHGHCGDAWTAAYNKFKIESAWRGDAVHVFLAGGGALIPGTLDVFKQSWMKNWGPYPCHVLPTPESVGSELSSESFSRFCVAFGLCTPIPELTNNILPSDSPDFTPPAGPRRDYSQDGDQLLPRYGWT